MMDECGCAGVMIGRGALGNPWIFKECVEYFEKGILPKEVTTGEKLDMMKKLTLDLVGEKGEHIAVLELRTMLMYFLKGLPNTKELKLNLCKANSKEEILNIIDTYQKNIME